jgi:hypothetical protein
MQFWMVVYFNSRAIIKFKVNKDIREVTKVWIILSCEKKKKIREDYV